MRLIEFFEATRLDELVNPDNPKFRKWFRNSKVTDITGKRPQMVFHGTKSPHEFIELQPGTHFGTPGQAEEFAAMSGGDRPRTGPGRIFPVYLRIENPIEMWDSQASHGDDPDAYLRDLITHAESVDDRNLVDRLKLWANAINWDNIPDEKKPVRLIAFLKKLGYDGIVYSNRQEDKGYRSWIPFNKSQIKYVYAESITEAVVYHGSPHKFGKFDIQQIGSGQGAQTYGWGLYFAEEPDVALDYYKQLTRSKQGEVFVGDKKSEYKDPAVALAIGAMNWGGDPIENLKRVKPGKLYTPDAIRKAIRIIKTGKTRYEAPGAVYTVEIPDQVMAGLLDWDKPINEQPENVREAFGFNEPMDHFRDWYQKRLEIIGDEYSWHRLSKRQQNAQLREYTKETGQKPPAILQWDQTMATGKDLYQHMTSEAGSPEQASKYLDKAGVPGLKFLDQFSREKGKGTYNIVMFDDRFVNIVDQRVPGKRAA